MKKLMLVAAGGALALGAATAAAATSPRLFETYGNATVNGDGSVSLVSDTAAAQAYGGIRLAIPSGLSVRDLRGLSARYDVTDGDCAGGSPRFQLNVGGRDVFVYVGPAPNFTGCASGRRSTGNLIASGDNRFDLSRYGGPFYGTWSDVRSMLGTRPLTGIELVVDGGWWFPDGEQTVVVGNVRVNGTAYEPAAASPTTRSQCMRGGWQRFDHPSFGNQGRCLAYVEHNDGKGPHGGRG